MSCSSHTPENDQKVASKKVYNKRYYAENKERILARQNNGEQRTSRFSKPDVKDGMKLLTRNDSSTAREPIVNRTRNISELNYQRQYRKNNREQLNKYWRCYYAKNKEQTNQRLRDQRQRKMGARESEKLETSPSVKI